MIRLRRHVFNAQPAARGNRYKTSVAAAALIYLWWSPPVAASTLFTNNSGNRLKARLRTIDSRRSSKR
jgi:hypothetical protein